MKSSLMSRDVKFQIAHSIKNCINLDEDEECNHDCSSEESHSHGDESSETERKVKLGRKNSLFEKIKI